MTLPSARSASAALLLGTMIVGSGCATPAVPPPPKVPVTVARAERRDVPYTLDATGTVEPLQSVSVMSQVSGVLTRVVFKEGDEVRAGQLLFEIDARPYRAALQQAQAVLARDQAQATNATQDVKRYETLVQKEYVTAQQYAQVQTTAASLQATLGADRAAVESARLNLQNATIRSPITGRTGNLLLREGNLVKAGADRLVTVNQVQPIVVRFPIQSSHLADLRAHAARDVTIRVQTPGGGPASTGTLSFIDNAVDTTTGTILLKGRFSNTDSALWPGEFVTVRLQLYVQPGALVVPSIAVMTGQRGSSVFVIDANGKATSRPVTVERTADSSSVISRGLTAGEQVVTDGQLRLSTGSAVDIKPQATPTSPAPQEGPPQ